MDAKQILANAGEIIQKANTWGNEKKLVAVTEILSVLLREHHLTLESSEWEFVTNEGVEFLRGPSPLGSIWVITGGP